MTTPRTLSRAPLWPEGCLDRNGKVASSPPVEEYRVAGRWSFVFYTCSTLRTLKTTPALRATPPPEGNLVRNGKKQMRHRRTQLYHFITLSLTHFSLLSALCYLLSG